METNHLIGEIYEAALDQSRWKNVLTELNLLFKARHAGVVFYDSLNMKRKLCWLSGEEPERIKELYINQYLVADMSSARVHCRDLSDAQVITVAVNPELPGFEDPEYYKFVTEDLNSHYRMAAKLMMTNYSIGMTSVNRGAGEPLFCLADIELYKLITPHLSRAFRIHHQLSAARVEGEKLLQTINKIAHGVLLLDSERKVLFANEEGTRIANQHPAVEIDRIGRLKALNPADDRELQKLLCEVIENKVGRPDREALSVPLRSELRLHPLKVTALPLMASKLDASLSKHGICVVIFITDFDRSIAMPDAYLKLTYKLTHSECRVAEALANGSNILDISRARGVEESTVRWQVKNLLSKTNTRSQAELVRLLSALGQDFAGCAV